MIVKNAFPEYQKELEAIDRELYFTNLIITKGQPGETPRNQAGRIIIPFPGPPEEPPMTLSLIHISEPTRPY